MAGVEEVRAGITQANQNMRDSVGALQQASEMLEQAQSALLNATQGSAQEDMQHAHGAIVHVMQTIASAQDMIQNTMTSAEAYAGRL
ncbi:hypothetical protein SAMN02982929_04043 [Saccharopolyspora kobensis]|uniref:Uncharacterized protein n=1 Tax=Saccharopolyspora kobensis TaxID=146035 RepID=A0A1H6D5S0_9PSEU|nr:hypothetical protein [Saccharopolyspora kobensis]SEG80737.1 hypothetical protein SAMN02982929_04043 [Saccharopolyspora kobensis]SFD13076.1 hypothetical protein SAMN05216506_102638 [Saccharopolyspora kobensis]